MPHLFIGILASAWWLGFSAGLQLMAPFPKREPEPIGPRGPPKLRLVG
jgi:hypothetical protein